jgi:hypothetical protein
MVAENQAIISFPISRLLHTYRAGCLYYTPYSYFFAVYFGRETQKYFANPLASPPGHV